MVDMDGFGFFGQMLAMMSAFFMAGQFLLWLFMVWLLHRFVQAHERLANALGQQAIDPETKRTIERIAKMLEDR